MKIPAEVEKALMALRLEVDGGVVNHIRKIIREEFEQISPQTHFLTKSKEASEENFANIQNAINNLTPEETNRISDGYHTFGEIYEHRIMNYIALCRHLATMPAPISWTENIWRSTLHSDGTGFEGWFMLGIFKEPGKQITYHLPNRLWDDCDFAVTLMTAPEFDGHNSADVLERLKNL